MKIEPINSTYIKDFRDFGFQAGIGMEYKVGGFVYRNAYCYPTRQDVRCCKSDAICKAKLINRFWRYLGAV